MPFRTVLVVDDDNGIREVIQEALESEGYDTCAASNGKEALKILSWRADIGLVLLDLTMPVMSGSEFIKAVQSDFILSDTPIVVLSAVADEKNSNGAIAYLRKPLELCSIFDLVEKHCLKKRLN